MRETRHGRRWVGIAVLALVAAAGGGCFHAQPHGTPMPPPVVPPDGAVPRELIKTTLPPYVVEAPDMLLIEVFVRGDLLKAPLPNPGGKAQKDPAKADEDKDQVGVGGSLWPKEYQTRGLPIQQITGQFAVRMDGTVGLGFWGAVPVAGLSLEQASQAVRNHLLAHPTLVSLGVNAETLYVIVDVLAYNSKRYYVILDGGGYGEQVYPFPITGSETVMDAIANVNGLHAVASKRNIWVARRCPHPNQPYQILPVDWIGTTQHGFTTTNYQILPGDRIYVKAQKLVTIDTALARVISPIERVLGVTLLGATTVNNVNGRTGSGSGQ